MGSWRNGVAQARRKLVARAQQASGSGAPTPAAGGAAASSASVAVSAVMAVPDGAIDLRAVVALLKADAERRTELRELVENRDTAA